MGLLDNRATEPEDQGPSASDELIANSKSLKKVMAAIGKILYTPGKASDSIFTQIAGSDMPMVDIGHHAAALVQKIDEKSGDAIPEDEILPAGDLVLNELLEASVEGGLMEAPDDQDKQRAFASMSEALFAHYDPDGEEQMEMVSNASNQDLNEAYSMKEKLMSPRQSKAQPQGGMPPEGEM